MNAKLRMEKMQIIIQFQSNHARENEYLMFKQFKINEHTERYVSY